MTRPQIDNARVSSQRSLTEAPRGTSTWLASNAAGRHPRQYAAGGCGSRTPLLQAPLAAIRRYIETRNIKARDAISYDRGARSTIARNSPLPRCPSISDDDADLTGYCT